MQQTEQEQQSWIKLSVLVGWLLIWQLLPLFFSTEQNLNFDNKFTIALMYILQVVGVIFLFILPAILFSAFWTKSGIHYLGVAAKPAMGTLLIAALGMVMAMPMINWLAELNQHMQLPEAFSGLEKWMKETEAKAMELTEALTAGTSIKKLILNLFVIAFMAALSEEIFFRGIVQKVLIECFRNKHVGVWLGAILFSAFHMQFYGFIPRMMMGAYLGYLFLWSGSIWPSILAHFTNNAVAVYIMWLINRGAISADIDKMGVEPDQFVFAASSLGMVLLSLFIIYRIEKKRSSLLIE